MSTDHDRMFKELLHHFFDEFLLAFFPEIYEQLDLSAKKFLSEELFPDLIDGDKKRADVIAETKLKSAQDLILIIHLEAQNYYQVTFPERMFIYFCMIYLKFRKPVLPIAIFSYNENKNEPDEYVVAAPFLRVNHFRFLKVELHKMDWKKFMNSKNPVSAALMSRMHYSKKERVQVRLAFLRQLVRMNLDEARLGMINGFFETYLQLDENEEEQLMKEARELPAKERDAIIKWPNAYYDRGVKKGIEQGIERGIEQGIEQGKSDATREFVRKLLKERMSSAKISDLTGLSEEEIGKMAKEDE
ncbi:Rpn family recombination-promoting nuclease/putative transposase [Sporolactobacillus shoreae]|uniref:Rpn family recombination-promoting nuclease/putative transposase n=1 Tax=Sporolactobacillus shoreae TaxID=1465501 RepID=A0A4Z0GRJ4_9BACL|nr:Rpn family recombination-promoting nuclease/putative transposase [Sporolactobacillus shoreae]TGA99795.1 Rpn family recombination-promoting nuclease/putative transposase [Sporolactobacillus shoreae]